MYAKATSVLVPAAVQLILRGEPFTKVLSNLLSVVVNHLLPGRLLPINRGAFNPFLYTFLDLLHDLIPFAVAYIRDSAALIVADVVADGHENLIVVDSIRGRFNGDQVIAFALEHENTRLDADKGLKCVGV